MRRSSFAALAAAGALIAVGIAAWALPSDRSKRELGLVTSLPIYWSESVSIAEAIEGGASPHWVRDSLEEDYRLVPLDTLDGPELGRLEGLVLAQPRPLAPGENIALDEWVRAGGRLILFADPLLTEHSRYAIGDKRRPQDVALLSPILRRWGLELTFDEDQADEERGVSFAGTRIPLRLAGLFVPAETDAPARCALAADGVVARCTVGKGRVLVIADAAVLEADRSAEGRGPLKAFLREAFDSDAG